MKLCGNFPQTHPDWHNMKKLSSDLPDLGGSQKNIPIHLIWDVSEEIFRPISKLHFSLLGGLIDKV